MWHGISGSVALTPFFYCITMLPLAAAIGLGFCGVVLLLHPALQQNQLLPSLLGLISGFLAGVTYLNVRQLGMIGEPNMRTVFYFSLIAPLSSGVWMLFDTVHTITLQGLAILLWLGFSANPSRNSR